MTDKNNDPLILIFNHNSVINNEHNEHNKNNKNSETNKLSMTDFLSKINKIESSKNIIEVCNSIGLYKPSIISYSASDALHYKTALRGDNNSFIYNYMIKKINCDINPNINYNIKKGIAIIKWKLYNFMIKREKEKQRLRKDIDYDEEIINWLSLLIGIYLYFDEKDEMNFKQSSLLEEITKPFTVHSFTSL